MRLATELKWQFTAKENILGLHLADQDMYVGLFDEGGGVYVLDPAGVLLLELGFSRPVRAVRVSEGGQRLWVLDQRGWLSQFDLRGKRLWEMNLGTDAIAMDARAGGQGAAVGHANGLVSYFNSLGKKLRSLYLQHSIDYLKFAHDLSFLVAANQEGNFSLIDPKINFMWKESMDTVCQGIDIDRDGSLILFTALSKGVYAYDREHNAIGAYDIDQAVFSSALCQKGERIILSNRQGHLFVLKRNAEVEHFMDTEREIPRMDLNYNGDRLLIQSGDRVIKALHFVDLQSTRPGERGDFAEFLSAENTAQQGGAPSGSVIRHQEILWESEVPGGGEACLRLFALGAFCAVLSEYHVFGVWNQKGEMLWKEVIDPSQMPFLVGAQAGNLILLAYPNCVDIYHCERGRFKRLETWAEHACIHEAGLNFALATTEHRIGLFDRPGNCLWSVQADAAVRGIQVSPNGQGVFALFEDGSLKLFREQGKLVWAIETNGEKAEKPARSASQSPGRHPLRAEDGFAFRELTSAQRSLIVLRRGGITVLGVGNRLEHFNEGGKAVWTAALEEPVNFLKNLGDFTQIRFQSSSDLILNSNGQTVVSRKASGALREYVVDKSKKLLVVESDENNLYCSDPIDGGRIWQHEAKDKITQFHVDWSASRLVYLSQGRLYCLPFFPERGAAARSVGFLEF